MRIWKYALLGLVSIGGAMNASATTVVYDDESDFLAAAGPGLGFENFDAITDDISFNEGPVDVGAFSAVYTGGLAPGLFNLIDAQPAVSDNNPFGSTALVGGVLDGETVDLVFDAPITAFGATFHALNNDDSRSEFIVLGESFQLDTQVGLVSEFVGFISSTPFTTVTIRGLLPSEGYGMDDVWFGTAAVVPLPGSLVLLFGSLAGLGAVGASRRPSNRAA